MEKILPIHGLEELVLLKRSYYPKQYTYSIQFYQNSKGSFNRNKVNNPKIFYDIIKGPKQSWERRKKKHLTPWFQAIWHSYSNQNSMILAQKQCP